MPTLVTRWSGYAKIEIQFAGHEGFRLQVVWWESGLALVGQQSGKGQPSRLGMVVDVQQTRHARTL